jgi:ERCC4-related helicase
MGQGYDEDGIGMSENVQKANIESFKRGKFNLLVSTDIAQEGLDVPECNYVIRYEFVSNEIGTVKQN